MSPPARPQGDPRKARPEGSPRAGELDYHVGWRAAGVHPGSHRSRIGGAAERFRGVVPLGEGRDARRIDARASATDPFDRPWVRDFHQPARIPVVLLADLSRSMRFAGAASRLQLTADFARALARGAFRRGDAFGFVGCDREVQRGLFALPAVSRHAGERVAQRLEALAGGSSPEQGLGTGAGTHSRELGAEGLLQAATHWLPRQRALVFLLSDGYLPDALLDGVLRRLARHQVVVVLLADSAERLPPARWGLVRLADLEGAGERLLLLRPGSARRLAEGQAERLEAARRSVRRHGASLLVVEDALDLRAAARHFLREGPG